MRFPRMSVRSLILAALSLGLVLAGIKLGHDLYYEDLHRAYDTLAGVRGIADVHVYGYDDVTYEVALATFALEGRPDAVVEIRRLGDPGRVWLQRLGPWEFPEYKNGFNGVVATATGKPVKSPSVRNVIDVGPSGAYAAMLPVKIRDLNDVVSHYDELAQSFSTWPRATTWGELEERPEMRTAYCVKPAGSGTTAPPPGFPGRGSRGAD